MLKQTPEINAGLTPVYSTYKPYNGEPDYNEVVDMATGEVVSREKAEKHGGVFVDHIDSYGSKIKPSWTYIKGDTVDKSATVNIFWFTG
jgi:hypothetical protein